MSFIIESGVKQGYILAPNLLSFFFSMLLNFAFKQSKEGVYLLTRNNDKLFNLASLGVKTKVSTVLIKEMLFADDATLATHTEHNLQKLVT